MASFYDWMSSPREFRHSWFLPNSLRKWDVCRKPVLVHIKGGPRLPCTLWSGQRWLSSLRRTFQLPPFPVRHWTCAIHEADRFQWFFGPTEDSPPWALHRYVEYDVYEIRLLYCNSMIRVNDDSPVRSKVLIWFCASLFVASTAC